MSDYRNDFRKAQREVYWSLPRVFFMAACTVCAILVLGWFLAANEIGMSLIFLPWRESIRRDTMIQSRAYSEATTREMYRLKIQYVQAKTDAEKDAIKALAIHEASGFDRERLPRGRLYV